MSHILKMATAVVMLAFAATGVAQARAKYTDYGVRPVYASRMSSQAPRELWPWNVPAQGLAGFTCDLPSSTCSGGERIYN